MMKTDWDSYYKKPFFTALGTRKITQRIITGLIKKYVNPSDQLIIAELGGGNSIFYDIIKSRIGFKQYCVIDNNQRGLDQLRNRVKDDNVLYMNKDILFIFLNGETEKYDLVFSVGVIEHFDREGTARAILAHFALLKENGVGIITFPTPTLLYRIVRKTAELITLWKFPDERPLHFEEVENIINKYGHIIHKSIIWPIIFTQGVVVFRFNKREII